jgi:hypothetical protein
MRIRRLRAASDAAQRHCLHRPCEGEAAARGAVLVDVALDPVQQFWRIVDLIQDDGRRKALEDETGIGDGLYAQRGSSSEQK